MSWVFDRARRLLAKASSAVFVTLAGCATIQPSLAPQVAQPRTPPSRNFTSFNDPLRCMDKKLVRAGKKTVLISSTGIPDKTNKVRVGADDMLVNAVNQMNGQSKAFVFIDQPLERKDAQIVWLTKRDDDPTPRYYIRGSISQLDEGVIDDSISLLANNDLVPNRKLNAVKKGFSRRVSVVTVDLSLASYPDRKIIPGGSVANSMVVVGDGFGAGLTGVIDLSEIGVTIGMERIESVGQAVRNLIELGTIELLGKQARLPYWECLSLPEVKIEQKGKKEVAAAAAGVVPIIEKSQLLLADLGYYSGSVTGRQDSATRLAIARFQADQGLIASGQADYDLLRRLREKQTLMEQVKARLRAQQAATMAVPRQPVGAASAPPAVVPSVTAKNVVQAPLPIVTKTIAAPPDNLVPKCPAGEIFLAAGCSSEANVLAGYLK